MRVARLPHLLLSISVSLSLSLSISFSTPVRGLFSLRFSPTSCSASSLCILRALLRLCPSSFSPLPCYTFVGVFFSSACAPLPCSILLHVTVFYRYTVNVSITLALPLLLPLPLPQPQPPLASIVVFVNVSRTSAAAAQTNILVTFTLCFSFAFFFTLSIFSLCLYVVCRFSPSRCCFLSQNGF